MTGLQCPKCTSVAISPSSRKNLRERLGRLLFRSPFRCRLCGHRFFAFATDRERRAMKELLLSREAERAFAGFPQL